MCHPSCIVFGAKNLDKQEIRGKRIIEVGSYDVNGSLRPILESWGPAEYIGVDIQKGPGVDIVCNAEKLVEKFGRERFDVVLSTELLEHARNWKTVISNIKNVCAPNGLIVVTTRSYGFGYHAFPHDFWRYEVDDIKHIFSDCEVLVVEKDFPDPGVFVKARKPKVFVENDLSNYKIYSIVLHRKTGEIAERDLRNFYFRRLVFSEKLKSLFARGGNLIGDILSGKRFSSNHRL